MMQLLVHSTHHPTPAAAPQRVQTVLVTWCIVDTSTFEYFLRYKNVASKLHMLQTMQNNRM